MRSVIMLLIPLPAILGCAGSVIRPESHVVVERITFDGSGDTLGREATALVRNTDSVQLRLEVRFEFATESGAVLSGREIWTPLALGPGESMIVRTVCPFSTASKATPLVRAGSQD